MVAPERLLHLADNTDGDSFERRLLNAVRNAPNGRPEACVIEARDRVFPYGVEVDGGEIGRFAAAKTANFVAGLLNLGLFGALVDRYLHLDRAVADLASVANAARRGEGW